MESDPDSESGGSPTFPKKETTFGKTQEIVPGQEDVTPPPPVSDVRGRLTTTLHQLSAVTGHRERWNRYEGSYEAQSFFTNYDAQADRYQLQYSTRLRKPPNLLQALLRVTNTRATISRRMVANGLHSCRPLRRLPLTPPNRRQRLEWCRARSTWMTEWHRVVFSDESCFCLSSDSRRVRVWRRRGERSNPAAIVERPTVRQRGIMVWGAIAYDSRSPLLRIQGTMTAQRYVDDVLRPVTLPYLQGVPNALYQQDNARPHPARISQQALQDVQMLPWPPYSPDLSPIEHVWDIIGRRLHALPQPRSEDELWQMIYSGIYRNEELMQEGRRTKLRVVLQASCCLKRSDCCLPPTPVYFLEYSRRFYELLSPVLLLLSITVLQLVTRTRNTMKREYVFGNRRRSKVITMVEKNLVKITATS
ncbi:hypothetical protein LAZ67_X004225 [Cordylochernes scorpioides]|uniref:Transposable element Tc1 transposase n=1 Tax=Cordylochernes scorpioides TaxID=51811 RepID=A0ABY6LYX7_9ARAC|nr:hypothetical protein LAZ67_X004225 [Cordylochernes scorpioides]